MQNYVSCSLNNPITIGYWSPIILMPLGMVATIPFSHLKAIFLHELYHIRNKDYLLNILQTIICIFFFYHPLVWWLSSRINEEREHRCDDATIAFTGNPMALVRALTYLQEHHYNLNHNLAMSLSGNKSKFNNRIYRLFNPRKHVSFKVRSILSLVFVVFIATAFTFLQIPNSSEVLASAAVLSHESSNTSPQDPIYVSDSSNVLMYAYNISIIEKKGKLQIVKKGGAASETLLVVDGRFAELENIEMIDSKDIASLTLHKSEAVGEGIIAIHTNDYRKDRFRGFVKSVTEKRTYPKQDYKTPLFIYMIEGTEVSEEEFNKIEYGSSSLEGIGVEDALIRYGIKGRDGVVILNKRIY